MATTIQTTSEQPTTSLGIHENTVPVSDPNLLISGDYTRLGDDLILTGSDGARFHVEDYFAGQSQPTLVAADGAKVTGDVVKILAGPQFAGQYAQAAAPDGAESIGKVETLNGTATATRTNGVKVELKQGDPVFKGDVVETGKGTELGITFVDETVFSLSAEARMVLNELVYQPGGQSNSMLFNLVKGTFGFVSGKIAPSGEMDIQTPVAIMAIRGTAPIVELNIGADGNQVNVDGKFFLAVVKGHSGIVHLLDPETRELKAILDDPLKGITISGSDGITTFDLTVADLFFVQTLVQNRIEPLLESLDPEGGPEDLIKKIKNSFDDIFNLLGDTGLGGATLTLSVTDADGDPLTIAFTPGPASSSNGVPTAGTISITIDVEDNEGGDGDIDAGAGITNETVVGALPINFGLDGPGGINFASLSGTAVTDTAGRTVTSGGEVVTYSFSGNTLTASTASGVVFQVVINDVASGTFTVNFFEPLDEPISGTEDEITLSLPFQVIDGNGSAATGTLVITVDDDSPEIGVSEDSLVDEDDLPLGNMDSQPGDNDPITNSAVDGDGIETTVGGTLGISFGADDANSVVDGGTPAGNGDRAVTFSADAVAALTALGLTSNGETIDYVLSADGTAITAVTGTNIIFTVSLSDTGSGSYLFDLQDAIDHPDGLTEDNINLVFEFTATDSDGDSVDGSFTVAVDDDKPIIGASESALVDEDDLGGTPNGDLAVGNNNDPAADDDDTKTNISVDPDSDATTVGGSLKIAFGADNGDMYSSSYYSSTSTSSLAAIVVGPPATGGSGMVTFSANATTALAALGHTSEGDPIAYALSAGDTVLTATAGGRTIFTVELSDVGEGSYLFDLVDAIDHPDGLSEDNIDFVFEFVATDNDGDTATGSFTVTVDDDAPKLTGTVEGTVEEEALASGNEDTLDADGNDTDTAGDSTIVSAVATGSLQGMVTVGADEVTGLTGGASFTLSTDTSDLPDLESNMKAVAYDVDGNTLTAYVDNPAAGTPGELDLADTIVFTLQVQSNGDYTFTLKAPLDHPDTTSGSTASNEETLSLDLSSIIVPSDQDGDAISVTSAFTINVIDDVPIANADTDSVAEDGTEDATGNVLTGLESPNVDSNGTDGEADFAGADNELTVVGVASVTQPAVGTVGSDLDGKFGTLTLNADGSYVYKVDNGNTTVDALNVGNSVQDEFEYTVTDADGDTVTTTLTIMIDGTNDAPVVTGLGNAVFAEQAVNAGFQPIDTDVSLTDVDTSDLSGGQLAVSYTSIGLTEDQLTVLDSGIPGDGINVSGTVVSFDGVAFATIGTNDGSNGSELAIDFDQAGAASVAAVEALIEAIGYANTSDTPAPTREISITVSDGDGGTSTPALATITVNAENDPPSASGLPNADLTVLQGIAKDINLENIVFSDPDLQSGDLTLIFEVTVGGGMFSSPLGDGTDVNDTGVDVGGSGTKTLKLTGDFLELQSFLSPPASGPANVQFTSGSVTGNDAETIQLRLNDNGNTGGSGSDVVILTSNVDIFPTVETFDNLPSPGPFSNFTSGGLFYDFTNDGDDGSFTQGTDALVANSSTVNGGTDETFVVSHITGSKFTFDSVFVDNTAGGAPVTINLYDDTGLIDTIIVPVTSTVVTPTGGAPIIVTKIEFVSSNFSDFVIDDLAVSHFEDPIVLDLGAAGIDLTSAVDGVRFDLDADGTKDAIGWTSGEDGILAMDLDGSGAIENGQEIFSPDFGDGGFTDSLEALASLDDNGDGRIDANDTAYDDLLIWVDANHDGISQDDELASLLDHGIASIDLGAETSNEQINGQQILSEGEFTLTSGETKSYAAVGFESLDIPSSNHAPEISGAHDLGAIAAQDANTGTVVADLVSDLASDADPNSDIGIAVTAAQTQGSGTWQYRSADGSFVNFPAIALGAAFLLAFDMIVRFVPDAAAQTTDPDATGHIETPPSLTFHAWDGSAGEAGDIVDIGATGVGGQTPFSTAEATSSVEIAAEAVTGRFTDDDDTVDLNSVVPNGDGDGAFTDAGAGNDSVTLPDVDAPLSEQLAGQTFYGGAGDDIIIGGDGDDIIDGGDGNDLISGGAGDDILAGGLGFDTLTGGEGADTFVLSHLDAADLIADYDFSAGDEIDLSGLFTVYSDGSEGTGQDDLGDFVRVVENGDGAVDHLQVDVDGGGDSFVNVASINADSGVSITYSDDSSAASTNSGVV